LVEDSDLRVIHKEDRNFAVRKFQGV
jgi:hypothetical protein